MGNKLEAEPIEVDVKPVGNWMPKTEAEWNGWRKRIKRKQDASVNEVLYMVFGRYGR